MDVSMDWGRAPKRNNFHRKSSDLAKPLWNSKHLWTLVGEWHPKNESNRYLAVGVLLYRRDLLYYCWLLLFLILNKNESTVVPTVKSFYLFFHDYCWYYFWLIVSTTLGRLLILLLYYGWLRSFRFHHLLVLTLISIVALLTPRLQGYWYPSRRVVSTNGGLDCFNNDWSTNYGVC